MSLPTFGSTAILPAQSKLRLMKTASALAGHGNKLYMAKCRKLCAAGNMIASNVRAFEQTCLYIYADD